jgi:hypothetical protein
MLPGTSRQQVPIPGIWHFQLRIVIPIGATAPAGMVRDFTEGNSDIPVLSKPRRHTRRHGFWIRRKLGGPLKQRIVAGASVSTC